MEDTSFQFAGTKSDKKKFAKHIERLKEKKENRALEVNPGFVGSLKTETEVGEKSIRKRKRKGTSGGSVEGFSVFKSANAVNEAEQNDEEGERPSGRKEYFRQLERDTVVRKNHGIHISGSNVPSPLQSFEELSTSMSSSEEVHDIEGLRVVPRKRAWKAEGWTPDRLHCYPENHVSHRPLSGSADGECRHFGFYDSTYLKKVRKNQGGRDLLEQSGFSGFIGVCESLGDVRVSKLYARGLLEWWWDTTNSFHMPWGEITITPLDFSLLTGLPFTGRRVPMVDDLVCGDARVRELLGPVADTLPPHQTIARPVEVARGLSMEGTTDEQKVRIFLLLLVCGTLRNDKGTRVSTRYLEALSDLARVASYDWAELGYCSLICGLRASCRQRGASSIVSLTGAWRLLEFWCYEHFPRLAPDRVLDRSFPAAACWAQRGRARYEALPALRKAIRGTAEDQVVFRPWFLYPDIPRWAVEARDLTACRAIFYGELGPIWYLGERVTRQFVVSPPLVPQDPPVTMMDMDSLVRAIKDGLPIRHDYLAFVFSESGYADCLISRLAPRVRYNKAAARARVSVVPDLRIQYMGATGLVEETIDVAPEAEQHSVHALPADVESASRETLVQLLRVVDSLKHGITKLKRSFYSRQSDEHHEPRRQQGGVRRQQGRPRRQRPESRYSTQSDPHVSTSGRTNTGYAGTPFSTGFNMGSMGNPFWNPWMNPMMMMQMQMQQGFEFASGHDWRDSSKSQPGGMWVEEVDDEPSGSPDTP